MAKCDICGKRGERLEPIRSLWATPNIRDICFGCSQEADKVKNALHKKMRQDFVDALAHMAEQHGQQRRGLWRRLRGWWMGERQS